MSAEHTHKRFIPLLLLGTLGLLVAGDTVVKFLERLMIYYPLNDHHFETPTAPIQPVDIYWTAEDGNRTHGWFLENPDSDVVLVYFHGNAGSISGRFPWAVELMGAGVSVLMVEYRGYGRSEGEPSEQGIYADAHAVWTWLTEERNISSANIILYGKSLGGGAVTELASQNTPGGVVLQSTFTSIPDMAKRILPLVPRFLIQTQFDNESKLRRIEAPTLIIHSRTDDLIPFEQSERNARAAKNLVSHLIFDGYGHNDLVTYQGTAIVHAIANLVSSQRGP